MTALFSKNKKTTDKAKEEAKKVKGKDAADNISEETESVGSSAFSGTGGLNAHRILKGFYISEKASLGNVDNQYTFRVFKSANKSEVKKEVTKLFNVKVRSVKILNMPEKRRDFGKHPGTKTGFKKAVVILKEGYTIGQAKP